MDPILIIVGFSGLAVAALAAAVMAIVDEWRKPPAEARLAALVSNDPETIQRTWLRTATWRERLDATLHVFGRAATVIRHFLAIYEQADVPLTLPSFLSLTVGLALVCGIALPLYLHDARLLPLGIAAGGGLPVMWMLWRRKNRLRQFSIQLPEALDLVARALRSGHSLHSALAAVTEELLPPISTEFRRVGDAVSLGTPLETALESMLLRVPLDDLRFFVTAVMIQSQSGGNLGEVLDKIGDCVREKFRIEGQVQALTGEGRVSAIVLIALPIVTFFGMLVVNPEYTEPLFNDPIGQQLFQVSIGLLILGTVVIQRIVKVDV